MRRNTDRLAAVGPRHPVHGFPLWYADANGTLLGLGLDRTDSRLPAIGDPPDRPPQGFPPGLPADFPDESFYFLAEARMPVGGGPRPGRARLVLALEAAFAGTGDVVDGQQAVFGRVRVRIDGGIPNATYEFTHPYGSTGPLPADDRGRVFVTEDIAVIPLDFTAALGSQLAPFLRWTTGSPGEEEPPDGYLGDGVTEHTVTGSPFGTNFFRVDGFQVAAAGGPRDPQDPANPDRIQTALFTVQGRVATVLGVEISRVGYQRAADGSTTVDVFARTLTGQTLEASAPGASRTRLTADGDRYLARLDGGVQPAAAPGGSPLAGVVEVANITDVPPSTATAALVDEITITLAEYDTATRTLTVRAESSDRLAPPALRVEGAGPSVDGPLTDGERVVPGLSAPPAELAVVSVRPDGSAAGGARADVRVIGPADPPLPVVAVAGPDQRVRPGASVALDGSGSTGAAGTAQWAQVSGAPVALSQVGPWTAAFTAPPGPGELEFDLTVPGPGGPSTDRVLITVLAPGAPRAVVGQAQPAGVGDQVRLDASGSLGATGFSWRQLPDGPPVTLRGADSAVVALTMPGGTQDVNLELTVSGPDGPPDAAVVTVPRRDDVTVIVAEFRTGSGRWRVSGTATGSMPDRITVSLGDQAAGGQELGTVLVDPTGAWDLRRTVTAAEPQLRPAVGARVQVTSSRAGQAQAVVLIRQ